MVLPPKSSISFYFHLNMNKSKKYSMIFTWKTLEGLTFCQLGKFIILFHWFNIFPEKTTLRNNLGVSLCLELGLGLDAHGLRNQTKWGFLKLTKYFELFSIFKPKLTKQIQGQKNQIFKYSYFADFDKMPNHFSNERVVI